MKVCYLAFVFLLPLRRQITKTFSSKKEKFIEFTKFRKFPLVKLQSDRSTENNFSVVETSKHLFMEFNSKFKIETTKNSRLENNCVGVREFFRLLLWPQLVYKFLLL